MSDTLFDTAMSIYCANLSGSQPYKQTFVESVEDAKRILKYCEENDINVPEPTGNDYFNWVMLSELKPDVDSIVILSETALKYPINSSDDFVICRYLGGNVLEVLLNKKYGDKIHVDNIYKHILWRYV